MGMMILILLSGSALPVAEIVIPTRFSNPSKVGSTKILMESGAWQEIPAESEASLETALGDDQSVLIEGQAFYPRFYEAGKGEPRSWPDFIARSCDRLEFFLVGPQNVHVILPIKSAPVSFPNGSEVIVLGYRAEDYLESMAVFYLNSPSTALVRSDIPFDSCSKE